MRSMFPQGSWAYTLVFCCVLFAVATPASGQDADAGAPGDWLSRYSGARTVGFGGAFVANMDEPTGVLWNPAGLSRLFQNEVRLETGQLFEGTAVHGVSFIVPARGFPSFGLTYLSLKSGDFERTNELNEPLGSFSEGDFAFMLSAAKNVSRRVSVGSNLKIVRQTVEEFDAAGYGADLGMLVEVTPRLRVGGSVLNLGGPTLTLRETEEKYPVEMRGGLALYVLGGRGVVSAEVDHRAGPGASFHAGGEVFVHSSTALRLGTNDSRITGGLSFQLSPAMRMDYGVADHEIGITHRFGLSYRFGGFFASSVANPPVFSPTGEQSVTRFQLKARTKSDAREWSLEIFNDSKQVVRRFGGIGAPPQHVMWDGKDLSGLPAPDGIYDYKFVVWDDEGRRIEGNVHSVEITTTGPRGTIPVLVEPETGAPN